MLELKVLFATDLEGAEDDVRAGLELATRLARERAATLVILHVVPIEAASGEGGLYQSADLLAGLPRRALERLVPPDPGVAFRHALEVGNPEERIAAFVERERVELLVMEARRRSGLSHLLGRSLVERLSLRALCPIVTYRAEHVARETLGLAVPPYARSASPEALARLLDTRVNALLTWMHLQREAARSVAEQRSIRDAIATLCRNQLNSVFAPSIRGMLELELSEHQRALGALGVEVVCSSRSLMQLGASAHHGEAYAAFMSQLERDGVAVSVPLEGAAGATAAEVLILAGARVLRHSDSAAYVVFALDARRDFLRILAQPGPTPSAETYAFDVHGLMLSNSRFPEQLRRMGLLPAEPGAQAARRLRVCDPVCDPSGNGSECKPLTRMAAAATAGHDGCDWTGYRDYRGVEVIGAWRWLPDYGFGVAAEMDRSPV